MNPANPEYPAKAREIFARAAFVRDLGIALTGIRPGACESELEIQTRHLQQNGYVHAGVLATLADHTAGAAAGTLVRADQGVLSIEFKINFLRPAVGGRLRCRSQVLRPGRTLSVVESELLMDEPPDDRLVAKATVTLAIVPDRAH
jgi:uncharacterized protein (TIGR00369 family)